VIRELVQVALVAALVGCGAPPVADEAARDHVGYPDGAQAIAVGATLPDLTFEGVSQDGAPTVVHLGDYYDPDSDDRLLIVVSGGLWCGTCRWPAQQASTLLPPEMASHVRRLDLVVGDRDNAPATRAAAKAWLELMDMPQGAVGADPDHRLGALFEGAAALPLAVIVDPATMTVTDALSRPRRHELIQALAAALVDDAAPTIAPPTLVDGLFDEDEWALLQRTTVPGAPPSDPTNAVADDPAAAALGEALFFDVGLSPSGEIACATCHEPEHQYYDDRPLAEGVAIGRRRAPSIALAAHGRWQFWDGRADTLWSQALGPLEAPKEHGSSRVQVARRVLTAHADAYQQAFPDAPLLDPDAWPEAGRPGDPAYDALPAEARDAITAVFVHAGKAIAAYERTLRVAPNPLDAYLAGDFDALNEEQKYGLQLFVRLGCQQCHWGPRLTDDAFHHVGIAAADAPTDAGRFDGLSAWRRAEFGAWSRWSDAPQPPPEDGAPVPERLRGQLKTPPLRGVAHAPFLDRAGSHEDLASLMQSYGWPKPDPAREPWVLSFGETAQWGLLPLLDVLTAEVQ